MKIDMLGAKVTTKKIGNIPIGTLVAILTREEFEATGTTPAYFTGYEYSAIGYIKFDKPQREISLEEWKEHYAPKSPALIEKFQDLGYSDDQIYEMFVTYTTKAYFPLEEIVPFEDE
jgi:hypothetical protein